MNIANKLTVLRIILIPVLMTILLIDLPNKFFIGGLIFAIASLTDFLDGFLARKYNLVTKLGKFLDPLADKLLVIAVIVVFVELNIIPSWVTFIIISRELIISIFRAIAASEGVVIAASWWGKLKTNSQILMILVILFNNLIPESIYIYIKPGLIIIATLFTVFSGLDYIIKNKQVLIK